MAYFVEVASFNGKWQPQRHKDRPVTTETNGVVKLKEGGVRVRTVTEIPECFEKLTLDQLYHVLSPDGNFYNMNRQVKS